MCLSFPLVFLLLLPFAAIGQKEGYIWYFGNNAGIDFNTSPPTNLTNGALSTIEGCATICTGAGALRFYTDGIKVYNRNHQQMSNGNGLSGNPSSTQSGIIVPNPDSSNVFYVFTTSGSGYMDYSVVDLSLNSGLGDVRVKNIHVMSTGTEKLTAVKHANNRDIWVVSHQSNNNAFYAVLVTGAGVSGSPVVSNTGSNMSGISPGWLKFSPDGRKLVAADYFTTVQLFDFDPTSGVINNPQTLVNQANYYGVEFSPLSRYLYLSRAFSGNEVVQYDLQAGNLTAIQASRVSLSNSFNSFTPGALQLAPDGKIYMALYSSAPYLAVINAPEQAGTACNFVLQGFDLSPKTSSWGLPSFNQSYFRQLKATVTKTCHKDSTLFVLSDTVALDSVRWSFGDTTSGSRNTSAEIKPYHIYTGPGTYKMRVTAFRHTYPYVDSLEMPVVITALPSVSIGPDTTLCKGTMITYIAPTGFVEYLWRYKGDHGEALVTSSSVFMDISYSGMLSLRVKQNGCYNADTIYVYNQQPPALNLGKDTALCNGEKLYLDVSTSASPVSYLWGDNKTVPFDTVKAAGKHWVTIKTTHCAVTDSINVTYKPLPQVNLGNDSILCSTDSVKLDARGTGKSFLWNDNSTDSIRMMHTGGQYWVRSTLNGCSRYDTVNLVFVSPPVLNLGADTTLCQGDSLLLNAAIAGGQYTWNTGASSPQIRVKTAAMYKVTAANTYCKVRDSIQVNFQVPPVLNLGKDTSLCEGDTMRLNGTIPNGKSYLWNTNILGPVLYEVKKEGDYSIRAWDGVCYVRDTIHLNIDSLESFDLGPDQTLCEDTQIVLQVNVSPAFFAWQDGSTLSSFPVNTTGEYRVTASYGKCTSRDTVNIIFQEAPEVSLGKDTILCDNAKLQLKVNVTGASYLWSDNSSGPSLDVNVPGSYWLRVKDGVCTVRDTIQVDYAATPYVDLRDTQLCGNAILPLDVGQPGCTYLWDDGSQLPGRQISNPGTYWVRLSRELCVSSDTMKVNYIAYPVVDLGPDTIVCESFYKKFEFSNPFSRYLWQDGSKDSTMEVKGPGKYTVTVTNACATVTDEVVIDYVKTPCTLYVPKAFSPNDDNINEVFMPEGYGVTIKEMLIFNRWGELVFSYQGDNKGWDGTYSGKLSAEGFYMWRIRYEVYRGRYPVMEDLSGTVLLLR